MLNPQNENGTTANLMMEHTRWLLDLIFMKIKIHLILGPMQEDNRIGAKVPDG